ncbi:GNAT family N-acetyltransferase [Bacillus kwashiorkori]|uniref:GNAT family N-acetyltransferase n=1 Tax=Bacillus kwashiorkori TaxID=1522318 RepID=UPI00193ABE7C|nr:GNAT family N-acetyltransferase [Bacillus kwashiorkori]
MKDNNNFVIRFAEVKDVQLILQFIHELAEYEKLRNEVVATEELLRENVFNKKMAEVIIGEYEGEPVGFALFFHNFSTFIGKPGIYLEDLYVRQQYRNRGFGKMLLSHLAKLAVERDCGRLEWSVLNWNEPSIQFYKNLGAIPMNDWTVYRVHDDSLKNLAKL